MRNICRCSSKNREDDNYTKQNMNYVSLRNKIFLYRVHFFISVRDIYLFESKEVQRVNNLGGFFGVENDLNFYKYVVWNRE